MNYNQQGIELELREIFSRNVGINIELITENSSPENTDKWDSLTHVNLITEIEKKYNIHFSDEDALLMMTYGSIRDAVAVMLEKKV